MEEPPKPDVRIFMAFMQSDPHYLCVILLSFCHFINFEFLLFRLLPHIRGNVGFVFTKHDLVEVRDKLVENRVRAPARAGALAPCPVDIEPMNTGLGPEKTSFFQALSIPTKISKGTIEIIVSFFLFLVIVPCAMIKLLNFRSPESPKSGVLKFKLNEKLAYLYLLWCQALLLMSYNFFIDYC